MTNHEINLKNSKTYTFKVVVEPDEDRWFAYCPALHARGASTWGYTQEEALKNIREVVEMTVESMIEDNETIPESEEIGVTMFSDVRVAVVV